MSVLSKAISVLTRMRRAPSGCVIDFYGPSDLKALGDPLGNTPSPISKLLGGSTISKAKEAIEASPVTHVDDQDVPFMIIHGTRDPVVPLDQSETTPSSAYQSRCTELLFAGHGWSAWRLSEPRAKHQNACLS